MYAQVFLKVATEVLRRNAPGACAGLKRRFPKEALNPSLDVVERRAVHALEEVAFRWEVDQAHHRLTIGAGCGAFGCRSLFRRQDQVIEPLRRFGEIESVGRVKVLVHTPVGQFRWWCDDVAAFASHIDPVRKLPRAVRYRTLRVPLEQNMQAVA